MVYETAYTNINANDIIMDLGIQVANRKVLIFDSFSGMYKNVICFLFFILLAFFKDILTLYILQIENYILNVISL